MKAFILFFLSVLLLSLAGPTQAALMSSSGFSQKAAGFSCGGALVTSTSFNVTATLGQATPIRSGKLPKSISFRNYPGLRYQLEDLGRLDIPRTSGSLPGIYLLLFDDE